MLLRGFFSVEPGEKTELQIPGEAETLRVPECFDAVVGNPPYISYRRQANQPTIEKALVRAAKHLTLPTFSGKSDAYVWFFVHATRFLRQGGRCAFIVSAAMLSADYGVPLVRFLGRYFRTRAVVDSSVERWFVDADTNTVMLLLEREDDPNLRGANDIRFIRFRRPLAQLLPAPDRPERRGMLEDLVDELLTAPAGVDDPRWQVNIQPQGTDGGLELVGDVDADQGAVAEDDG